MMKELGMELKARNVVGIKIKGRCWEGSEISLRWKSVEYKRNTGFAGTGNRVEAAAWLAEFCSVLFVLGLVSPDLGLEGELMHIQFVLPWN